VILEIDKFSIKTARSNVSLNSLEDRIKIFPVQAEEGILVPLLSDPELQSVFLFIE
jgi:23S rRNA A1618 N6-methylase RlmF